MTSSRSMPPPSSKAASPHGSAGLTTSVVIVLEATGAVEGIRPQRPGPARRRGARPPAVSPCHDQQQRLLPRIEGVPAGTASHRGRDPVHETRGGSATVTVLYRPDRARSRFQLEARATIVGRVLDAAGNPVPGASVRLPLPEPGPGEPGGYRFVIANHLGIYRLPDIELGDHLIPGARAGQG